MICNRCGKEISGKERFCVHCGAEMSSPASPAPDAKDALVGRTIDNKYRIDSVLGSGGMGTVYRATRLMIGDEVAVKVLHTDRITDSQGVERFRREAQAAARLKHPNVVTIYDFSISSDGSAYLIMELVEGRSLRRLIEQQAPVDIQLAADITSQVCAALDEAHRRNIVHRDLKPDNIIITESSGSTRVKVLDFGIAKLRDVATDQMTLTQAGTVMGTPHYMSPEQCMGEELDGRSDIYSLGIVLYEMLTGSVPFDSTTMTAVVLQHVTAPPPPLRERNPKISPAIERVVMDALEKNRAMRPQTAGEFARELITALSASSASPPQTRERPRADEAVTIRTNRAPQPQLEPTQRIPPQQLLGPRGWAQVGVEPPVKKSRGGMIAAVIISIILVMGGLAAAYFFLIKDKQSVGANGSANNSRAAVPTTNTINRQGNGSVNMPPTNTSQTNQSVDTASVKGQVTAALQSWTSSLNSHNFEAYMSHYANTLDVYYGRSNVSIDTVRTDKERAFRIFSRFNVQLSSINISVDTSGTTATATFDKTWTFYGDSISSGSVQSRLWLANIGGRWRITGEKDLKVYYKN